MQVTDFYKLTRPVQEYIPEFTGEGKEQVCVHHLLTHTSGLNELTVFHTTFSKWDDSAAPDTDGTERPDIYKALMLGMDSPLDRPPGTIMDYCNFNPGLAGEISRVEGGHALTATVAWGGRLECSRCLAPYDFSHEEDFSLVLYPRKTISEAELSLDRDDLNAYFYDEPIVPVAPIVEERIQIAIPMKPLCREDCRGLCPQCGGDRNVSECNCVVEFVDPRWRGLQLLRKDR